jgi:glycosyltransferase involved in cell wall biosynthesis
MKPLLHLTYDSPDNPWCGGGGSLRDWRILKRLKSWDRSFCTGAHPHPLRDPEIRRIDRGLARFGEFVSRRTYAISAGRVLRRFMRRPGAVASQSPSAWAPLWETFRHVDRMLLVVHHVAGEEILRRLGPLGPSSLRFENRILAEGRFYATPNRATAARIREANPGARIEVIPNGYDPPLRHVEAERFGEGPTISFLGRFDHRMKGLDRLLPAFAQVADRIPDARLVMAGRSDHSTDSWLEAALAGHPHRDRIHLVPNPDEERKYALLDGSDVFCVPSRFEGWCIAAIEAQSRGLPVVATRTDGTVDSVRDGETGVLVDNSEEGATAALARELESLCRDADRRRAWGASAKEWAERFTWEAAAQATESMLLEIADRPPPG